MANIKFREINRRGFRTEEWKKRESGTPNGPRKSKVKNASIEILKTVIKQRGASITEIEHYLAVRGFDLAENSIKVMTHKMVQTNYLYRESFPCKCCKKNTVYYYATDFANLVFKRILSRSATARPRGLG